MGPMKVGRGGARPHRGRPLRRGGSSGVAIRERLGVEAPREPDQATPRRRSGAPTQARLLALRVLERVERARAYADLALHGAFQRSELTALDRGLATELVYGTLRWRGRIDYLLDRVLDRELGRLEPLVRAALRLGAYQILFSDRIPASAAVDQSVRCVRATGAERATGLVNAVLRRLREQHASIPLPGLEEDPLGHLVHALSLPEWIARRWLADFGAEEAAALLRALNQVPPRALRANPLRCTREELLGELRERFPAAAPSRLAPRGILLGPRGDAGRDPAFLAGLCTIQDEASQAVVALLAPQPGERVLDTCAAPGAKATAAAEDVGPEGRVVALDRHGRRLDLLRRDARRLGLANVEVRQADATLPLPESFDSAFDRVLVDAPCSGLGTLRRNPDARWRLRPADPGRLARVQGALLRSAARAVRRGGTLVYSTCTVLREENEEVVQDFLEGHPHFRIPDRRSLPEVVRPLVGEDGALRCLPHRHGTDGFFAVRMERVA